MSGINNPPPSGIPANPELAAARAAKVQANGAVALPGGGNQQQAPTGNNQSNVVNEEELFEGFGLSAEDEAMLNGDDGSGSSVPNGQPNGSDQNAGPQGNEDGTGTQVPDPNAQQQPNAQQPPPDMGKLREAAETHLETTLYALDEDTKNKLISEPDKVLPKLAARLHLQVIQNISQYIPGLVTKMVEGQLSQRFAAQKAESGFFGKFPELAAQEHRAIVVNSLKTIRAMNPQATREQLEQEGAALAAFRIQQKTGQQPQRQQQPVRQGGPPQRQQAPVRQAPFAPASPGGTSVPNAGVQPEPGQMDWSEAVKSDWWEN